PQMARPARRVEPWSWRRYYSLRNLIIILIRSGDRRSAVRIALVVGLLKPLANLPSSPRVAATHIRGNLKAIRDGFGGRLGRRLEPDGSTRAHDLGPNSI